jgi:hypothetical protein
LKNKDGSTQALTEEMLRARKAPRQMAVIYVDDLLIVTVLQLNLRTFDHQLGGISSRSSDRDRCMLLSIWPERL